MAPRKSPAPAPTNKVPKSLVVLPLPLPPATEQFTADKDVKKK